MQDLTIQTCAGSRDWWRKTARSLARRWTWATGRISRLADFARKPSDCAPPWATCWD